jgi:hypothetical protein
MKPVEMIKYLQTDKEIYKTMSDKLGHITDVRAEMHLNEKQHLNDLEMNIETQYANIDAVSLTDLLTLMQQLEEKLRIPENTDLTIRVEYPKDEKDYSLEYDDFDCETIGKFRVETYRREYDVEIVEYSTSKYLVIKYEYYDEDFDYETGSKEATVEYNVTLILANNLKGKNEIYSQMYCHTNNPHRTNQIEYNKIATEINEELKQNLPLIDLEVEKNLGNQFITELKEYTNDKTVNSVFKDMEKFALNVNHRIFVSYVDDRQKGVEIKYYIKGHGFIWNNINREPLEHLTINSQSYLLDDDKIGYLEQEKYHINDLISDRINQYEAYILEYFKDCIDFDEQCRYGGKHIVFCLNKGLITKTLTKNRKTYFFNKNEEVICQIDAVQVKDTEKLKEKINNILEQLE